MYFYGDNHLQPVNEARVQRAPEIALPGAASMTTSLAVATGAGKDMLRHATLQGTAKGGAPEPAVQGPPLAWFLAYTRPGQEQLAQHNLSCQAYESYFPQYRRAKKIAGETTVVVEPLFPRYVFFRPERAGQSITPVRSTRGISHIVRFGEMPATVQPDTLGMIRRLEQERNMVDEDAVEPLLPGQKVRLMDSAFEGLEGLIKSASRRRVAVLLEFLGRQQLVSTSPQKVMPV